MSYIRFVLKLSVQTHSQCVIRKKSVYPELPEFVPLVLSVCQNFYCDHPFRDLSLSSNTWLQAKNWHTRKQIWFIDTLKLQNWEKSPSGFRVLFLTLLLTEGLGISVSLQYVGKGWGQQASWIPVGSRSCCCLPACCGDEHSPCMHLGSGVVVAPCSSLGWKSQICQAFALKREQA